MYHRVAVLGSRNRGWRPDQSPDDGTSTDADSHLIASILSRVTEQHSQVLVLSLGCDSGVGHAVLLWCQEHGVPLVEFRFDVLVPLEGRNSRLERQYLFMGRHAALLDLAQEFHVLVSSNRFSIVEDLVERLRAKRGYPYYVYNEEGSVIERSDAATSSGEPSSAEDR